MRSLIIIEVEHGETTDGVNEALFNMGIGSQFDPQADPEWPTGADGETWCMLSGIDYTIRDYAVRVDVQPFVTGVSINSIIDRGTGQSQ